MARITRTAAISHRSNLENIMQQFPNTATKIEEIKPYIRPAWWEPNALIWIEASKGEAKAKHDEMQNQTRCPSIYTGGSGIQGKVGAATYDPRTDTATLGSDKQYNVFGAETNALATAASIIKKRQIKGQKSIASSPITKQQSKPLTTHRDNPVN